MLNTSVRLHDGDDPFGPNLLLLLTRDCCCVGGRRRSIVEQRCLNKPSCEFTFGPTVYPFGPDPCPWVVKTMAIAVQCPTSKPPQAAQRAVVSESGVTVWDGNKLVGGHPGISSATDEANGVAFSVRNGVYSFAAVPLELAD